VDVGSPPDEGVELLDCEGDEIDADVAVELDEVDVDSDDQPGSSCPSTDDMIATSTSTGATPDCNSELTLYPQTSDLETNNDCAFLNDMKQLLEKHTNSTSKQFLPYMCQLKAVYSNARSSIRKWIKTDLSVLKTLTAVDGNTPVPAASEETDSSPSTKKQQEQYRTSSEEGDICTQQESLEVGTYVLVANGQNHLPAYITRTNPLAVRYYQCVQGGYNEEEAVYDLLEDVFKILKEPEIIRISATRIWFKFDI